MSQEELPKNVQWFLDGVDIQMAKELLWMLSMLSVGFYLGVTYLLRDALRDYTAVSGWTTVLGTSQTPSFVHSAETASLYSIILFGLCIGGVLAIEVYQVID